MQAVFNDISQFKRKKKKKNYTLNIVHVFAVVSLPTVLSQVEPSPIAFGGGGGRQALNRRRY